MKNILESLMFSTLTEDRKLVNNTSVTVNTNIDSSEFNTTEHRRIEHNKGH